MEASSKRNNGIIEDQISKSIKSISKVKDRVSIKVKKQYEENPYPRWENIGLSIEPRHIKDVVNDSDLNIDLKKIPNSESPEILIAGCGTGQHALTTASKYKNAKILALDLSFKSLSYAKRKANELVVTIYRPLEIYTFLILEYLVLILIVSYLVRRLEKKLKKD